MVKHFDRCLCTNLRTGTIIIGVLGLLGGFYYVMASFLNVSTEPGAHGQPIAGGTATRVILGIIGLVEIILNALLIYGAVKRIPKLIRPWVLITAVLLCLGLIAMVAKGIMECISGQLAIGLTTLISALLTALIQVYCILIVNSFHTTLMSGDPVATQTA